MTDKPKKTVKSILLDVQARHNLSRKEIAAKIGISLSHYEQVIVCRQTTVVAMNVLVKMRKSGLFSDQDIVDIVDCGEVLL